MKTVVIISPELGVYMGNGLGLAFWSKLDFIDQDHAPVFDDEAQARKHIQSWENNHEPDSYLYYVIAPTKEADDGCKYVSIEAMTAHGLGQYFDDEIEDDE